MKQKIILFSIIFLRFNCSFAQTNCHCEENFNWAKETFEKNDAGFEYALQQKGKSAYQEHNEQTLEKIKSITDRNSCAKAIEEWLKFFRKAHFFVAPIINNADANKKNTTNWEEIQISEKQVKEKTSGNDPYLGIWKTGAYTIGIINENEKYKGIILNSTNNAWKPYFIKLIFEKNVGGIYYLGDFSSYEFNKIQFIGKNTLQLGDFYLTRIYPEIKDDEAIALYAKEMGSDNSFIEKLSDKTILLRIPTFNGSQKSIIDSLLSSNDKILKSTENLIIDIRNNGGGDDVSYNNIIPLIYTNPIRTISIELLSTPLNNQRMEDYLKIPNLSENSKKQVNDALAILNANLGKFVNLDGGKQVNVQVFDTVFPNPKNVAIIVNKNNGSTAEQFLLAAKQSKKVKLYGVTTMGVLDISNMYTVTSPNNEIQLGYCLSKSYRIPDLAIDGKGIMPDYYIDKTIPDSEWLNFVQKIIEE